jgi:phage portal protein BeeE
MSLFSEAFTNEEVYEMRIDYLRSALSKASDHLNSLHRRYGLPPVTSLDIALDIDAGLAMQQAKSSAN